MPDYTHIMFTEIDSTVILNADGVVAIKDVKYPRSSIFSVVKKNTGDVGVPIANIKYKAFNGLLESNISSIVVNLKTSSEEPSGNDVVITIENLQSIPLKDHIVLNSGADRIKIISFVQDVGLLQYGSNVVFPEQVIMKNELYKLNYRAGKGIGYPYQEIKYKALNIDSESSIVNKVIMNLPGLTQLLLSDYVARQDGIYYNRTVNLLLALAPVNKNVKIKIEIDLINAWPENHNNEIILSYKNTNKTYKSNVDETISITVDPRGEEILQFSILIAQFGTDGGISGTIKATLIEVDGDVVLINPTIKEVIIDMSQTPGDDVPYVDPNDVPDYGGGNGSPPRGGGNHLPIEPPEYTNPN